MANPQKENGFTPIANEIAEAFCRYYPPSSLGQVLWCILRKTYGWRKLDDRISIGQIKKATGLSRRMVIYALQNLEAKRIIQVQRKRGRGIKNEVNRISFQKNYDLWVVQEKSSQYRKAINSRKLHYKKSKDGVVQETVSSARNSNLVVQETEKKGRFLAPTKETNTKETIKEIYSQNSDEFRLSELLLNLILERNPGHRKPDLQKWALHVDRMFRLDSRRADDIEAVIKWSQIDGFWQNNIISTQKLREKFDQLYLRMEAENNKLEQEQSKSNEINWDKKLEEYGEKNESS